MPTLFAVHVPEGREVVFHAENGISGGGPAPAMEGVSPWRINVGKQHIILREGDSFFHHADTFAMIRGWHLDLCVLGAYEVTANGDIAKLGSVGQR